MAEHFADRVTAGVQRMKAPCVVALDPVFEKLPEPLMSGVANDDASARLAAIQSFALGVIDAIAPLVPIVKINAAYFEVYGAAGFALYGALTSHARQHGLIVIGDAKRGDVGHTAEMYAAAHLGINGSAKPLAADAVTINGYFGADGAKPFIDAAKRSGGGVFVLVRTSNPSATVIQDQVTADGRKVHEIVAGEVAAWASKADTIGACGYSLVGAVAATRNAEDAQRLRRAMPQSILLVPGYGAQGGTAADFAPYFAREGMGAIIVAGRSVIYSHAVAAYRDRFAGDWKSCVSEACADFAADVGRTAGMR